MWSVCKTLRESTQSVSGLGLTYVTPEESTRPIIRVITGGESRKPWRILHDSEKRTSRRSALTGPCRATYCGLRQGQDNQLGLRWFDCF